MAQKLRLFCWLLIGSLTGFGCTALQAAEQKTLKTTHARFATTYESVTLPKNEKMGLLGGSFLYDVNDWLAVGGSSYGALAGNRGGFITLGFAAELRKKISEHAEIDAGLFVGAGGGRGGFTLQGGGLMLRTHLGAMWEFESIGGIGGGMSWVNFPNGSIHSLQPYLAYNYPFTTLIPQGWVDLPETDGGPWMGVRKAHQEFSLVYRSYAIPSGVVTDTGTPQHPTLGLMGVEWDRYLDDNFFVKLESEGAMQGQSQGYMQILLGAGYRQELISNNTWLKVSTSAGPAGGGGVATGGGVLLDAQAVLQQKLGDKFFAELGVGYVTSPGSSFRASSFSAMLGQHIVNPNVNAEQIDVDDLSGYDVRHLRLRLVNQRYLKDDPNWRSHHANLDVDLLGFQLDYFIEDWFFVSGQGIGAYRGKGGGYMTGLAGPGLRLPVPGTPLFVEADALVGAAGGGGLDVNGGLVWQADASLVWQISDVYSLQASYGLMQAPKGNFKAKVVSLSLGYNFSLPTL